MTYEPNIPDEDAAKFAEWFHEQIEDKMRESSIITALVPPKGELDWSICLQIGAAVLLDKPIMALVTPGTEVSKHLMAVADEIIEGPYDSAGFSERMRAGLERMGFVRGE